MSLSTSFPRREALGLGDTLIIHQIKACPAAASGDFCLYLMLRLLGAVWAALNTEKAGALARV